MRNDKGRLDVHDGAQDVDERRRSWAAQELRRDHSPRGSHLRRWQSTARRRGEGPDHSLDLLLGLSPTRRVTERK